MSMFSAKNTRSAGKERYDVVISRLNRAGVELVASPEASLQFGDILNWSAARRQLTRWRIWWVTPSKTAAGTDAAGVYRHRPGVLLGSIPLYVPGFPVALKLGRQAGR